jgi:GDP-L-fucose synthase
MKILITGGNGNIAKMINKNLSSTDYLITNASRSDLNVLSEFEIEEYLKDNQFDILVNTAILGGRRTTEENGDVTHKNLLMFENIIKFSDKFKMILNFDSAAIYDRNTDIFNRKEEDIYTIPTDYYGFSKYLIYQRSLQYNNVYNLRIFNIFHSSEEPNRFIKSCFDAKKTNSCVTIFEDKFFDFVYEDDFIKIVKFYFDNVCGQENLEKTVNICYEEKYKLSDIAKIIMQTNETEKINILTNLLDKNYSGDNTKLKKYNLELTGLENSIKLYETSLELSKNNVSDCTMVDNKPKKNIIIYTHMPGHSMCGGTVVEYYLGKVLEDLGQNVKIYTCDGYHPDNGIYSNFYNDDFPIDDNTVVIYCEGTVGNPLNAKYVVRWMLSELGKNVPSCWAESWGKDELVYYFLSELKFYLEPEKIGTVFKQLTNIYINPIFKRYNFEERSGVCYTIRKSHWHKNPIKFYEFEEPAFHIPHNFQHTEVVEYFNTYKMFISYDPNTFLTIMAALCGCISVVYPQDNLTKKEWLKTTAASDYFESKDSTDLYGVAYGMEDLQFAIDTINLVEEQWEDIEQFKIKNTVIPFINDINNFENMQNTLQNNFFKT